MTAYPGWQCGGRAEEVRLAELGEAQRPARDRAEGWHRLAPVSPIVQGRSCAIAGPCPVLPTALRGGEIRGIGRSSRSSGCAC